MLADDELGELAADIADNGLLHPIILDTTGEVLIDGRNRLKACEIAGVEPRFERLNGEDPVAFIVSANLARRNLNAGQRAIVLARIYPDGEKGGRSKKSGAQTAAKSGGFEKDRLWRAREIIPYPELANEVLKKTMPFEEALVTARKLRADTATRDEKLNRIEREAPDLMDLAAVSLDDAIKKLDERKAEQARLNVIRKAAPDLVARVNEARISIDEALAIHRAREEAERAAQEGATHRLATIMSWAGVADTAPEVAAARLMANVNPDFWPQDSDEILSADRLESCGKMLMACAVIYRGKHGKD